MSVRNTELWSLARVEVDPNSFARRDPSLSVAALDDAERPVSVGETIWAVQPDDDVFEGVALGRVVEVDETYGLLFLRVDWSSFHEKVTLMGEAVFDRLFGVSATTPFRGDTVWGWTVHLNRDGYYEAVLPDEPNRDSSGVRPRPVVVA